MIEVLTGRLSLLAEAERLRAARQGARRSTWRGGGPSSRGRGRSSGRFERHRQLLSGLSQAAADTRLSGPSGTTKRSRAIPGRRKGHLPPDERSDP